jgi:extradiol dioxygenase family protein
MFEHTKAFSGFSVNDLQSAKRFYGEILGVPVAAMENWLELRIPGGNPVLLYPKTDHLPATYTVLNFPVPDIENAVAALKKRGIRFETYKQPEIRTDGNGITSGTPRMAWFKDPAGNILSVMQEH